MVKTQLVRSSFVQKKKSFDTSRPIPCARCAFKFQVCDHAAVRAATTQVAQVLRPTWASTLR